MLPSPLRWLRPPEPLVRNPREETGFPLGRWNLYVGGAGRRPQGYVNLDILAVAGVDVCADAHRLPFRDAAFTAIECDAVLEHVRDASGVVRELTRVLAPGGHLHLVAPFCHPYHRYPEDYRRFSRQGLEQFAEAGGELELVASGWRTGPTATLLIVLLEYVKLLLPGKTWRTLSHGVLGWLLFPLRYLDLWLLRTDRAAALGNHAYVWLRKEITAGSAASGSSRRRPGSIATPPAAAR